MGSPTRSKPAPSSPAAQDSPYSSFVSSLSPLIPANRTEAVRNDVIVPSPQPVFTSPHMNCRLGSNFSRSQKPVLSGKENFSPTHMSSDGNFHENVDICGHSSSQPAAELSQSEFNNNSLSQDQSSTSPSSCINQFLAEPVEDSYRRGSAVLSLNQPDDVPCSKHDGNSRGNETGFHQPNSPNFASPFMANQDGREMTGLLPPLVKQVTDQPEAIQSVGKAASVELNVSSGSANSHLARQAGENLFVAGQSTDSHIFPTGGTLRITDGDLKSEEGLVHRQREQVSSNTEDCSTADLHLHVSVPQCKFNSLDNMSMGNCSLESRNQGENFADYRKEMPTPANFRFHETEDADPNIDQPGHRHEVNSQMKLEYLQNVQQDGTRQSDSGHMHSTSAGSAINDQEGVAQYPFALRKRLQFEVVENHDMTTGCNRTSSSFSGAMSPVEASHTSLGFGTVNMHHADSIANITSKRISVNLSGNSASRSSLFLHEASETRVKESDKPMQMNTRSSSWTACRPFGIGLHLNSLNCATSMNFNVNIQLPENESDAHEDNSHSVVSNHVPHDSTSCVAFTCFTGHSSAKFRGSSASLDGEMKPYVSQANNLSNSSLSSHSSLDVKPLDSRSPLRYTNDQITPCNIKRPSSEDATRSEESLHMSPKKKRKKAPENAGGRHCNCKKSKCLKLYCDCFAEQGYCAEGCTCQDCLNRVEHENIVSEARQQIESRNPLAFAPKVVLRVTESQKDTGDDKHITPTSARHKRGCNCKKSMCLKKYCECYQIGVGCSLGCRCEGCKNPFGRKDGCDEIIEMEHNSSRKEIQQQSFEERDFSADFSGEKQVVIGIKDEAIYGNQCHSGLSPLTPYIHSSNAMDGPKPQFPVLYYPSPESGSSLLLCYTASPSSPKPSVSTDSFVGGRERTSFTVHHDQELDLQTTMKAAYPGFLNPCNLSHVQNPSLTAIGSPMSSFGESRIVQTKFLPGGRHLSTGSQRWRTSQLVTPAHQFEEGRLVVEPDSDSALPYELEDDTPYLLEDSHSPIEAVKATSPNKKRVSPPKHQLYGRSSSTPPGTVSGRKYLLQSITRFPPLTPYRDNSNTTGDGT